ncbi:hypothetical protein [Aquitalea palustris]|uniref:hypothetical protein n=1 Tax=Aquitalea palustris TaxID=2480983 RepID=UPI001CF0BA93|nr:hypothetical protein [Aquitalea palustris]
MTVQKQDSTEKNQPSGPTVRQWKMLANIIQELGRSHQLYSGTELGDDLNVLGQAIEVGVFAHEGSVLIEEAEAIIQKHGFTLTAVSLVGRSIETAERLLLKNASATKM